MANYPTAMDADSTLYSPVDAFSTKPLETTATGAIGAGDSTISVASTVGGFAATYGIVSIDDELIVYLFEGRLLSGYKKAPARQIYSLGLKGLRTSPPTP